LKILKCTSRQILYISKKTNKISVCLFLFCLLNISFRRLNNIQSNLILYFINSCITSNETESHINQLIHFSVKYCFINECDEIIFCQISDRLSLVFIQIICIVILAEKKYFATFRKSLFSTLYKIQHETRILRGISKPDSNSELDGVGAEMVAGFDNVFSILTPRLHSSY